MKADEIHAFKSSMLGLDSNVARFWRTGERIRTRMLHKYSRGSLDVHVAEHVGFVVDRTKKMNGVKLMRRWIESGTDNLSSTEERVGTNDRAPRCH